MACRSRTKSSGILRLSPGGVVKPTKTTSPPYDELLLPPLVPPCRGGPRGGCLRAPTSSSKDFLFLEGARERAEPGPPAQPARACD